MKRICVYCGSSPGLDSSSVEMSHRLGQALVDRNLELVYGAAADLGSIWVEHAAIKNRT